MPVRTWFRRPQRGGIARDLLLGALAVGAVCAVVFCPRRRASGPPHAIAAAEPQPAKAVKAPQSAPRQRPSAKPPAKAAKHKEAPSPKPRIPEHLRRRLFMRVAAAMSVVAEPLRKTPTPEAIARAERAIREARDLIRGAPGTKEAREVRYWAFRYLELLGEHEQAEREFDAYLSEVVEAQGVAAALKILDREGIREEGIKNFTLAFQRFRTMLAFAKKGPAAATAYARMANVHAWLHQHELAVAAYRKALSFGPDAITARDCYQYLVRTGISNRDSEQALLDAKALAALPGNEATKANDQTMLGMVLEKTEGPVKAARHYRDILNKYPDKYTAAARWRLREIENNIEDAVLEQDP